MPLFLWKRHTERVGVVHPREEKTLERPYYTTFQDMKRAYKRSGEGGSVVIGTGIMASN